MNGATEMPLQSTEGRSDPPVKPTSEVAHRPCLNREDRYWETRCSYCEAPLRSDGGCSMWYGEPHDLPYRERARQTPGPNGAAEECSAERPRAPDRQPVAPAEGRAWETPAMRTV